ncbi:MAG: hypothetical protein V4686_01320 [Patescibacteria group bacterium]
MALELNEQLTPRVKVSTTQNPWLVNRLVKWGVVNNEVHARILLVLFTMFVFLLSICIVWNALSEDYQVPPPLEMDSKVNRN